MFILTKRIDRCNVQNSTEPNAPLFRIKLLVKSNRFTIGIEDIEIFKYYHFQIDRIDLSIFVFGRHWKQ